MSIITRVGSAGLIIGTVVMVSSLLCTQARAEPGESLFYQGRADYYGKSGPKRLDRALVSFGASCDAGYAIGCLWLGRMHADGEGTDRSLKRARRAYDMALKWRSKRCSRGDVQACFDAADLQRKGVDADGHGVAADAAGARDHVARGIGLMQSTCDAGEADACERVARELDETAPKAAATARSKRLSIFTALCDNGDAYECARLSDMYRQGEGVEESVEAAQGYAGRALKIRESACEAGSEDACQSLGHAYLRGRDIVPRDRLRARFFFQKACDLGHKGGCREVKRLRPRVRRCQMPRIWPFSLFKARTTTDERPWLVLDLLCRLVTTFGGNSQ